MLNQFGNRDVMANHLEVHLQIIAGCVEQVPEMRKKGVVESTRLLDVVNHCIHITILLQFVELSSDEEVTVVGVDKTDKESPSTAPVRPVRATYTPPAKRRSKTAAKEEGASATDLDILEKVSQVHSPYF
jgi:hypothetical protein